MGLDAPWRRASVLWVLGVAGREAGLAAQSVSGAVGAGDGGRLGGRGGDGAAAETIASVGIGGLLAVGGRGAAAGRSQTHEGGGDEGNGELHFDGLV